MSWRPGEEISTLRYNPRSTFAEAMEARDAEAYARLVQHYGRGCVRLARLLRRGKIDYSRINTYVDKVIDQVVEEIVSGWANSGGEEENPGEAGQESP